MTGPCRDVHAQYHCSQNWESCSQRKWKTGATHFACVIIVVAVVVVVVVVVNDINKIAPL